MSQTQRYALLSVFDKTGIVEFAQALIERGWKIIASGGTSKKLIEAGLEVMDVAQLVGGGAILGHKVVTLSREVHAGLLSNNTDVEVEEIEKLGIPRIDLVYVNLYPLHDEIANPNHTVESVIEKTDIGGPTMLRSAAKGGRIVLCDPADMPLALEHLDAMDAGDPEHAVPCHNLIDYLRAKTEFVVAEYCLASATFHGKGEFAGMVGHKVQGCKYGENGYQSPAALYSTITAKSDPLALPNFQVVAGESPSYNNWCDVDRMLQTITHVAAGMKLYSGGLPFIALAVKHGNCCGASANFDQGEVLRKTVMGDSRAFFGGLLMTNFAIDEKMAEEILTHGVPEGTRRILDGIVAPEFTQGAIEMLKRKGDKCRFIVNPALANLNENSLDKAQRIRYVRGGFLAQPNYTFILDFKDPELEIHGKLTDEQMMALILAKSICDTSNSNTITLVGNGMLIGNGCGQQDRVGAAELAIKRARDAGHKMDGAVASSDSFFPYPDGPQTLINAGIEIIFATKGSIKYEAVKTVCKAANITFVTLPDAKARGFFGH